MAEHLDNLVIENADIIFRNFEGKESKFNRAGARNFCVFIDDPLTAQQLNEDGWNVKVLQPRDPEDEARHYIKVNVTFGKVPPNIYMISGRTKTLLDEESVKALDYAEIKNADLIIRPYQWEINDKNGVSAYLKTAYFTIEVDRFAQKYAEEEYPGEKPWE